MAVVSGKAAFAHLDSTEVYNGQDTGRYTLTVTLDDDNAQILSEQGVKLKDYNGDKQRKFASKFNVKVIDANDQAFVGNIPEVLWCALAIRQALRTLYTARLHT